MEALVFLGETPGENGYIVSWRHEGPLIAQCRLRLEELYLYDWSRHRTHVLVPGVERLSWRAIDSLGQCVSRFDDAWQGDREKAWLAALDLQLEQNELRARAPDALLLLFTGRIGLHLDPVLQELLERADYFVDYKLSFRGPADEPLTEDRAGKRAPVRFLEKHEALLVPV